jgi:hypothetical protein
MSLGYKDILNRKCDIVQVNVSNVDLVYLVNPSINENGAAKMDSLKKRRKRLVIFVIIVILSLFSIIIFGTLCSDEVCALSISLNRKRFFSDHHHNFNLHRHNINNNNSNSISLIDSKLKPHNNYLLSYDDVLNDDFQNKFDINSNDVMVFLHIQKVIDKKL